MMEGKIELQNTTLDELGMNYSKKESYHCISYMREVIRGRFFTKI